MGSGRGLVVIALVCALSVAGCDGGSEPEAGTPRSSAGTETGTAQETGKTREPARTQEPGQPGSTAAPGLDPAMAVPAPGRVKPPIGLADMLVFSQDELEPQTVQRIKRLAGVQRVEPIGLAQVTIENRALNVAAVDPGTYRNFTEVQVAQSQEVWDRVAGGELAITPRLGRKLADEQGMIKLGVSVDAPEIHTGAYAKQIPQVDIVVNRPWGDEMGMTFGNALLITTGQTSPSTLRPRIERIAGKQASVQSLDAVARFGLDTEVKQTAFLTGGSVASVVGTFNYRVVPGGGGRIAPDPGWVRSHISTEPVPILGSMTCNRAMFPQLRAALQEIVDSKLADEIHPGEYAGCYYPRFIANTSTLSNHSFGLAFDLNVPGNQRGTAGQIDRRVVAIFNKWGFAWGGTWGYTDPMHFEMNRIVQPT